MGEIMKKKVLKPRIPVALNQHAGTHKDKKKEAKKYACRKSRQR